ncbi:MAG TPA: type I restriction endonuclease [Methanothrix sp.]|nr:type I restriction endonuclease [Methanothrix sp.]HPJ83618.1 type I restriction endonuclease [Methanothrix sp.]
MDFIDKIHELAARIPSQIDHIQTEEATKNALILPFISALGYNVFDPREVVPEFVADVGEKKGEKVDYAIFIDEKPSILFECKWCGVDLDKEHAHQLNRYFTMTDARFGVLTNGIIYRFYSDLEKPNLMDKKTFLEFNILDIDESLVEELKKFTKSSFNLEDILTTASELKYTKEIKRIIDEQTREPSDEFVKFFASQVYSGKKMTRPQIERFSEITKKALKQFINDKISERLKFALAGEHISPQADTSKGELPEQEKLEERPRDEIVTTEEEFEGYYIVKAILREITDSKRVHLRDFKSFCNILLDDNIQKPICRLYFNASQKYLGLFDEQKHEERVPIDDLDEIYNYADSLKSIIKFYDETFATSGRQGVRGTSIDHFELKGTQYDVDSWKNMLLKICDIMQTSHKDQFDKVLSLRGRKLAYFSKNPTELSLPEPISGTDIYVETSHSADRIVKISKDIIKLFGYSEDDLSVSAK